MINILVTALVLQGTAVLVLLVLPLPSGLQVSAVTLS